MMYYNNPYIYGEGIWQDALKESKQNRPGLNRNDRFKDARRILLGNKTKSVPKKIIQKVVSKPINIKQKIYNDYGYVPTDDEVKGLMRQYEYCTYKNKLDNCRSQSNKLSSLEYREPSNYEPSEYYYSNYPSEPSEHYYDEIVQQHNVPQNIVNEIVGEQESPNQVSLEIPAPHEPPLIQVEAPPAPILQIVAQQPQQQEQILDLSDFPPPPPQQIPQQIQVPQEEVIVIQQGNANEPELIYADVPEAPPLLEPIINLVPAQNRPERKVVPQGDLMSEMKNFAFKVNPSSLRRQVVEQLQENDAKIGLPPINRNELIQPIDIEERIRQNREAKQAQASPNNPLQAVFNERKAKLDAELQRRRAVLEPEESEDNNDFGEGLFGGSNFNGFLSQYLDSSMYGTPTQSFDDNVLYNRLKTLSKRRVGGNFESNPLTYETPMDSYMNHLNLVRQTQMANPNYGGGAFVSVITSR